MRTLLATIFWVAAAVNGAFAQNAVVTENKLTGTPQSEWDLSGPGSTSLQGFTTDISVNHGSTINFKIQASTNNWKIDIYRLGYYQGNGARLITTINETAPKSQPSPITNSATGEVDAGNWSVTASWSVPASAVSGVYIAHLLDQNNTNNENHIPFIVRADESTSDILFQTSDTTWQAYNGWGGANLYGGNGPGGDSAPGRAYKVSYNRPICTRDPCGTDAATTDFIFGAEFAAIYWLEQNGYDVSYIAEVDTARAPSLLRQHKIFTSTGHDEYWDTTARANVEEARAAGVNLVFMSGNEVYWKTRWEPSIDGSATPYRTLVCYKETRHNAPLDPVDANPSWTWTGTWRDPRFSPPADGGKPENALTGTIFAVDSYRSDSIKVPYAMSGLRFWRNTPHVAKTASGGTTTLTQNILGYEWDASPDNGVAPAGLIDLSSTTLDVSTLLLDYGSTTGNGTATHHLTLYRDPNSGALVFGAGTVFWAWGLSDNHDGPTTPTDPDIQQAMVNLLADMGVQPATLQSGLVPAVKSTDSTPPVSTISTPANGSSIGEGQPVLISGAASDTGGQVAGVEVSVDGGMTWFRASGTTNWNYTWSATPGTHTIMSRATDDSLNTENPQAGITISVTPAGSSLFGSTAVPDNQTTTDPNSVELGVKFSASTAGVIAGLRFWKDSINTGTHTAHLWNSTGSLLASATFANETASGWQTVLFSNPVQIAPGTVYTASYHSNNFYSATTSFFGSAMNKGKLTAPANAGVYAYGGVVFPSLTFNSENYWVDVLFFVPPPTAPPAITSGLTASAMVGVPFSYAITASNNPTSFNATGLPAGLSVDPSTGVISGTPAAAGTFSVTLSATNVIGTGSATLALTIRAGTDAYSLFSTSTIPGTVTVNDPNPVELGVKFSAAAAGNIIGMRFYKGPQNTGTHNAELWSTTGSLLASATFPNETASGWQTVIFANPVAIAANTMYVASYHGNGYYSADGNFFATDYTNGPLSAPASASAGGDGVYAYGGPGGYPSNTYNATNYWVDILFTMPSSTPAPVISSSPTASGVVGIPFSYAVTASNYPTSFNAMGLPAGLSVDTTTGVISGTPSAAGTFSVMVSATNAEGTGASTLSLTINAATTVYSLFSTSSVPGTVTVNDANSVELGVKFTAARPGKVIGMRFYKGPQNTGGHTAELWDSTGNLLASAIFSNETASGWQSVTFANPVAIAANTTYVASYHGNGYYSVDSNFFAAAYTNGPLTAPDSTSSGGNGVYGYSSSVRFPSNTYNPSNYWIDVMFQ
jgi:hypothetical protein